MIFTVTIDDNWYTYANDFDPDCGPLLTTLHLKADASFKPIGTFRAINSKIKHDKVFDCDVKIFTGKGEFRQKIKVVSAQLKVSGTLDGQSCTDLDGKCIPFDEEFSFTDIVVSGKDEIKKH